MKCGRGITMRRANFQSLEPRFPPNTASTSASNAVRSLPLWLHLLRLVLFKWWRIFVVLVLGNYIPGGIIILIQKGWNGLISYLSPWGLLAPIEQHYPVLFGALLAIFIILVPAGFLTERYYQAEKAEKERKN